MKTDAVMCEICDFLIAYLVESNPEHDWKLMVTVPVNLCLSDFGVT